MADAETARPRPGRPAQLNRERIVDAAFSAGNLDTLTMRDLAARLEVTHGALYRWVRNRDELFDLVSEVMIDRILPPDGPGGGHWREWLARVAWAMHDHFLSVPGYATRTSRPHRHTAHSFGRLRGAVVTAFTDAGVDPELAEQSWYIFITSVVSWLATQENPLDLGRSAPRFDLFLGTLLRGLPAREPGAQRPS
ncbi:TetR/AcrR family transcriptional regulator [Nocardia terpenica]|uniref:TetR/AcrR family transcriptional regulator n=1 Tax=Nocardia terpenica TaxID=455432 RepID=UPI0018959D64|nr:TetR/AcrR family transcriptional regulator [Nocardia terpenica]MBF6065863.1 TetR/AcrR family transcriptional regulator [Nocardia terpenica]MBF6108374.1 TetR/AcrR family transcriptional regulator [Nocardia terpenica]MBF6115978.1 TetR/AcrR family transcriptional regulator [Nocardia terpenica]MBF6123108.1 TetR/AcrR family transcriptional regulator [Nocardia terpenica]MBF6156218.1 TetR/AcrR family transcriptional regulator [Nocardia terpenica]